MSHFWLVQRLMADDPPNPDRGFDGFFGMEYMGSSEYEFSTPFQSLKAMRENGKLAIHERDVTYENVTRRVFFVATKKTFEAVAAEFDAWLATSGGHLHSKEASRFDRHFTGKTDDYDRTDAWWSFEDNIAWALTREMAETLLLAFNTKAKH